MLVLQDSNILYRVCDAFAIALPYPHITMRDRNVALEPRILSREINMLFRSDGITQIVPSIAAGLVASNVAAPIALVVRRSGQGDLPARVTGASEGDRHSWAAVLGSRYVLFAFPVGFALGLYLFLLTLTTVTLTRSVAARETDIPGRTVVWSEPQDPYYDLAREIARAEGLPLADALDTALAHDPEFLMWVVSPERLSEEVFSGFGAALQRHGKIVSVGLISGSLFRFER